MPSQSLAGHAEYAGYAGYAEYAGYAGYAEYAYGTQLTSVSVVLSISR
jgi:hypothetical protein